MNERFIDPSAEIGEGCTLGHGVVIEDSVRLGPGCSVGHHAVIPVSYTHLTLPTSDLV